ncbi:unnamed protein product [Symbiodinium microadriaticum]|nr:unnamed protein product [Symbiodinium microadriaticum]
MATTSISVWWRDCKMGRRRFQITLKLLSLRESPTSTLPIKSFQPRWRANSTAPASWQPFMLSRTRSWRCRRSSRRSFQPCWRQRICPTTRPLACRTRDAKQSWSIAWLSKKLCRRKSAPSILSRSSKLRGCCPSARRLRLGWSESEHWKPRISSATGAWLDYDA